MQLQVPVRRVVAEKLHQNAGVESAAVAVENAVVAGAAVWQVEPGKATTAKCKIITRLFLHYWPAF